MGGSLSVHSEGAGQGATFTVELPLTRQGNDNSAAFLPSAKPPFVGS